MPDYDPTLEALIDAVLLALDPDADMTQGYVDKLRHIVVTLQRILTDPESYGVVTTEKPPGSGTPLAPEAEAVMRQALGVLDAKAGDAELEYLEVLKRLQGAIEKELFKWASSIVQPAGFSGEIQIPVGGGEWERYEEALPETSRLRLTV
jgi:hypothetical protein